MKHLLISTLALLAFCIPAGAQQADGLKYCDARNLMLINQGFSGNARMDKSMAETVSRIDADCYVIDCLGAAANIFSAAAET